MKKDNKSPHFPAMEVARYSPSSTNQKNLMIKASKNKRFPITKHLVEISQPKINFSLNKELNIDEMIYEIVGTDWSIQLDQHLVNIESGYLWVAGTILGEITYSHTTTHDINLKKVTIPWQKGLTVDFSYPPLKPQKDSKEHFIFNSDEERHSHQVKYKYHNRSTHLDLNFSKITSTEQLIKNDATYSIHNQLVIELTCRLFQYQIHSISINN